MELLVKFTALVTDTLTKPVSLSFCKLTGFVFQARGITYEIGLRLLSERTMALDGYYVGKDEVEGKEKRVSS